MDLAVRIGEYDFSRRNETSSTEDIDIAEIFIHENFNRFVKFYFNKNEEHIMLKHFE